MARDPEAIAPRMEVRFTVDEPPSKAFVTLSDRLTDGLGRLGVHLDFRPGGVIEESGQEFGRLSTLKPEQEFSVETRPVTWDKSPTVTVRIRLEKIPAGTLVTLEVEGWATVIAASGGGQLDWYAGTLIPAILRQLAPSSLGDWVTDRKARRPTGEAAIAVYRDPTYHWPNFLLILDRIRLGPTDRLLEVACGGGAFLRKALESGCTALAIDHSPDMVRVTREANRSAIEAGRLSVLEGEADHLPAPDSSFTCCVCTGAFAFFPNPLGALREMYRTLAPGGRLAIYASSAALRGTPAAPEPIASRLRFYEPEELELLARTAGFSEVRVEATDEEKYARRAGLPEEVIAVFRNVGGAHLLLARKPRSAFGEEVL
jgi:SAM-dependent methyltransferase